MAGSCGCDALPATNNNSFSGRDFAHHLTSQHSYRPATVLIDNVDEALLGLIAPYDLAGCARGCDRLTYALVAHNERSPRPLPGLAKWRGWLHTFVSMMSSRRSANMCALRGGVSGVMR